MPRLKRQLERPLTAESTRGMLPTETPMTRPAILACAFALVALTACGGPPRTIALNYMKMEVSDVQAAEDKAAMTKISGVHNVIPEHARDGTVRVQIYVLDGKEASVMPKVEELGYTRVR
jgi:hypothetical protein